MGRMHWCAAVLLTGWVTGCGTAAEIRTAIHALAPGVLAPDGDCDDERGDDDQRGSAHGPATFARREVVGTAGSRGVGHGPDTAAGAWRPGTGDSSIWLARSMTIWSCLARVRLFS